MDYVACYEMMSELYDERVCGYPALEDVTNGNKKELPKFIKWVKEKIIDPLINLIKKIIEKISASIRRKRIKKFEASVSSEQRRLILQVNKIIKDATVEMARIAKLYNLSTKPEECRSGSAYDVTEMREYHMVDRINDIVNKLQAIQEEHNANATKIHDKYRKKLDGQKYHPENLEIQSHSYTYKENYEGRDGNIGSSEEISYYATLDVLIPFRDQAQKALDACTRYSNYLKSNFTIDNINEKTQLQRCVRCSNAVTRLLNAINNFRVNINVFAYDARADKDIGYSHYQYGGRGIYNTGNINEIPKTKF